MKEEHYVAALGPNGASAREKQIRQILDRGEIVVFTSIVTGRVKKVDRWEPDGMNDLKAFWHSPGTVPYVCWEALEYRVSSEPRENTMQNQSQPSDHEQ